MKYKITTNCECWTEYSVEANSEKEAREKFWDGIYEEEKIVDYANEEIEKTEEMIPVSNCCGEEVENIQQVGTEYCARCPSCKEGCGVEFIVKTN